MNGYFASFLVYTMAMAGIMLISVVIYKKVTSGNSFGPQNNSMKIEERLNLNAKKTLYVVKVGQERFLIASDAERTTFLSKLTENEQSQDILKNPKQCLYDNTERIIPGVNPDEIKRARLRKEQAKMEKEKTFAQIFKEKSELQSPVMKSLAEKLQHSRG